MDVYAWNTTSTFTPQGKNNLIKQIRSWDTLATSLQQPVNVAGVCFLLGGRESICNFLVSRGSLFQGHQLEVHTMTHHTLAKRFTVIAVSNVGNPAFDWHFKNALGFSKLDVQRPGHRNNDQAQFKEVASAIRHSEAGIVSTIVDFSLKGK